MHASVLRYFLQVVRSGSIRKAADQLNVSASAVNRQILLLEEETAALLFERRSTGMHLTQAGELLVEHVRSTLRDYERVRGDIALLQGQTTGDIRISTLASLTVDFIPSTLAAFSSRHPAARFEVRESLSTEVIDHVLSGESDIGFGFSQMARGSLEVVAEFAQPLGVIVAAAHPLARRDRVTRIDCFEFPIISQIGPGASFRAIERLLSAEGSKPSIFLRTNSYQLTRRMLKENAGLFFATPIGFREEIARGELVHISLEEPQGQLRIGLLVAKGRKLSVASSLMVKVFREAIVAFNEAPPARILTSRRTRGRQH